MPFATSWYLWFFFTFPVAYFALIYPYSEIARKKFILYHFCFYLIVNAVQIFLSSAYIRFMLEWLNEEVYSNILGKTAMSGSFYNFIIYAAIVVVINSIKYYRDLQMEKTRTLTLQKQLTDSRLSYLKQQLQPHFLFNAHHSIITLMKMGEKQKSIEMMEKLSDLMRFSLKENSSEEITLKKELSLVQLYLDIQKIRFEDKLQVVFVTNESLNDALVPSMILQPLVENSIKYSVERSSSSSNIMIKAYNEKNLLVLVVRDSYMEPFAKTDIFKGIGLSNLEERLQSMYNGQQKFELRFFENGEYKGLEVTLTIPLRYAQM